VLTDKSSQLVFGMNLDTIRVELSCEFRRIRASLYRRDLSRCKGDHLVTGVTLKIDIEVVEIPACSSHNDNLFDHDPSLSTYHRSLRRLARAKPCA
jgi:hypothetical protein